MTRWTTMATAWAVLGLAAGAAGAAEQMGLRLAYSGYFGGSQWDQPREIIPLADGSVVIGGQTFSPDLPATHGAVQGVYRGEPAGTGHPGVVGGDCFVAKLDRFGRGPTACTFFGGSKQERATYGMLRDREGNIVITTGSRSRDLPTTPGAYQKACGGGKSDVLLAKLSPGLTSLRWCTYVGGSGEDWPRGGLAMDADGNVLVVGRCTSPDFPATDGVIRPKLRGRGGDGMIVKVAADGNAIVWATLLGGSDSDELMGACVDERGFVYVAGHTRSRDLPCTLRGLQRKLRGKSDCWLACLTPDASKLVYCTYLGGAGNEFAEHRPLLLDDGSILLTGVTASENFPTTDRVIQRRLRGKTDGFLTKVGRDGRAVFSTYLGGRGGEFLLMPQTDAAGRIYLVGRSDSPDFPVSPGAIQRRPAGKGDGVLIVVSPDGRRVLYSTYLGGSGDDIIRALAVQPDGTVYLAGNTDSDDLPTTRGVPQRYRKGDHDGFVMKLVPAPVRRRR